MSRSDLVRILDYDLKDSHDQYFVDYGARGKRWVHAYVLGPAYRQQMALLKSRYIDSKSSRKRGADGSLRDDDGAHAQNGGANAIVHEATPEQMNCVCGVTAVQRSDELAKCDHCNKYSHCSCVRAYGFSAANASWWCASCRLLLMDPFSPGVEIISVSVTQKLQVVSENSISLRFNVDAAKVKDIQSKRQSVAVRCIALGGSSLNLPKGPLWPKEVTADVNSFRDVFKIQAPKYGHVRREPPSKVIDDLLRPGLNVVNLSFKVDSAQPGVVSTNPSEQLRYAFGIVISSTRSTEDIMGLLRKPSMEECKALDVAILSHYQKELEQLASDDFEVRSTSDFATLRARCPISLCEQELPARGTDCAHLQTFDAWSYVDVNTKTRNIEKRWRCPVCNKPTRPEDIWIDAFAMHGISLSRNVDSDALDSGAMPRLRLRVEDGEWEVLPEEEKEGVGSDDDDDDYDDENDHI